MLTEDPTYFCKGKCHLGYMKTTNLFKYKLVKLDGLLYIYISPHDVDNHILVTL